jgi:alkanesulfonate monooxygenase SsuD/methylene tetrahydromethanopterin reductase-like flavin-dependent oxidoreductase (luciferase family)
MRFAINVPNFGDYADPQAFLSLAREAEASGWDGFFVWDHILVEPDWGMPIADPWVLLSAAATVTTRIRLGPMVTPLPRRRPWVVARQSVTLDHLSGGRLTLGVGLGAPAQADFAAFGDETDPRVRAEKLDEGLTILDSLWTGEQVSFVGRQYQLSEMRFLPKPIQRPRIPIWVAGYWPHHAPFRRAAHWDGVCPASTSTEDTGKPMPLAELQAMLDVIRTERGEARLDGFDVALIGGTEPDPVRAGEMLHPYAEAGVTWWCEGLSDWRGPFEAMQERVRAGPPALQVVRGRPRAALR